MANVNELFNTIQEHYTEFEANHLEFVEKGNKAAAGRARKHIGEITELTERIEKLERTLEEFMSKWGPDVQRKRDERDERWDEMIRVLTIQERDNERRSTE